MVRPPAALPHRRTTRRRHRALAAVLALAGIAGITGGEADVVRAAPAPFVSVWVPYWSTVSGATRFGTHATLMSDVSPFFLTAVADGTVITVEEDAMETALKKAGKSIYESEWWLETLAQVLEHWGIYCKRSVDEATHVPRLRFSMIPPAPKETGTSQAQRPSTYTTPLNSGPLSSRLNSGRLDNKEEK